MNGTATARPLAVLVASVAAVGAAAWLSLQLDLAGLDADALAARVRAAGLLGPAVFVVLLIVQSIVAPLPSQPLLVAIGFLYGPAAGFAVGWLGVAMGACACFGLARVLGRPFVERFVSARRLATLDAYVRGRGLQATFLAVLSLRLLVHISFDVVSYGCGLIPFPFRWFVLATAVGEVPKVFAFTYLGASAGGAPAWLAWPIVAAILGALVVWPWIARHTVRGR